MNYQQQRVSTTSTGGNQPQQRVLKRMNSEGAINTASQHIIDDDHITGDVIRDRYPGDEMQTDDDEILQKSSIVSYQEQEHGGDIPFSNRDHHKTHVFGKKRDKVNGNEDITQMEPKKLQKTLLTLREAVAELYLGIKQKTRDENDIPTPEEEMEERDIIMSLDSYVIIEYIKSSVDIILNLKFEEIEKRLLDKNNDPSKRGSKKSILTGSQQKVTGEDTERSSLSQEGPCPKIYEELIQQLEGDIRKHIRIEQQLKLHIESMENRIEELENETEKFEDERSQVRKTQEKEVDSRVRELENRVKAKEDSLRGQETAMKALREAEIKYRKEIEALKAQVTELSTSQSKVIDPFSLINQAIGEVSRSTNQEVMNKTQPMIIKQSSINVHSQPSTAMQQIKKMSFQNQEGQFGSYSSNQSFAEGSSPERRTTTPDITHPYLHQTQLVSRKQSGAPGTGQKMKKYIPNSVVDSLGLQPQFNGNNSSYNTSTSGKVMGQRKLSSQHSRNNQTVKGIPIKAATQNSWIGQMNASNFASAGGQQLAGATPAQFSNIINNNIQGLSINYSNQIIQNSDPIQTFANNYLLPTAVTSNLPQNKQIAQSGCDLGVEEDSESSNLNSHRRCKSQNVKRSRTDNSKSLDRKKGLKNPNNHFLGGGPQHDLLSQELLMLQQMNEAANKFRKNVPLSNQTGAISSHMEETQSFEASKHNGNSFMVNESNRIAHEFQNGEIHQRRGIKNQANSVTQQTLSISGQQAKSRTASNRMQQSQNAVDEFGKNRFNQSYGGGGQSITSNGKQKTTGSINTRNANILFNAHSTNQSIEKARSRNKKGQLSQNHTVQGAAGTASGSQYAAGNLFDLNFKTTSSTQNQCKNGTAPQAGVSSTLNQTAANFMVANKNNSTTNTAAFLNQTNIQILKQQILAHKKASNLLMKGLSPLKK